MPLAPPSSTSALGEQAATWESALLQQLLAEPETQALLEAAQQTLDLATVLRWSRAKHGDPQVVEQALRAHLEWRADFVPGGSIPEVSNAADAMPGNMLHN